MPLFIFSSIPATKIPPANDFYIIQQDGFVAVTIPVQSSVEARKNFQGVVTAIGWLICSPTGEFQTPVVEG